MGQVKETMNKDGVAREVATKTGLTLVDSRKAVTAMIETLSDSMVAGKKITIVDFMTFTSKIRKGRAGRNPKTGDIIQIPAKKIASVKVAKNLAKRVKYSKW